MKRGEMNRFIGNIVLALTARKPAMSRNASMVFGFVSLMLASMAAPDATAANPCQPLEDAIGELATTPTQVYSAVSDGLDNKPTAIEMIYAGGTVYLKVADKWMRTDFTTQEMTHQSLEKQRQGSCHYEKDEPVGRQAAAVYSMQSQSGGAKAQLWISKSTGPPLRENSTSTPAARGAILTRRCAMSTTTFGLPRPDPSLRTI